MLAFGALEEFPLGDWGFAGPGVSMALPRVDLIASVPALGLHAGRNINLPKLALTTAIRTTTAHAGKSIGLPRLSLAISFRPAAISFGRSVNLPAIALVASIPPLQLRAGKNINLVAVNIAASMPPLVASPGKLLGLPALDLVASMKAASVLGGRSVNLPRFSTAFTYGPMVLQTGRIFNPADTLELANDAGALAEGALGEFALGGEGESLTQEYSRPVTFRFDATAIGVQAGRHLNLPALDTTVTVPVPEIDARRRKLRINAIAS